MKIKLFLVLIVSVLLVGCDMAMTPEELISEPRLSSDIGDLSRVIKDYMPKGAALTMPIKLNGVGAINYKDLDGCGTEEVIVLYKKPAPEAKLGAIILKKDITWILWEFIDLYAVKDQSNNPSYDIHQVEFEDVTGDGTLDLLIGCFFKENKNKELLVFTEKNGSLSLLEEQILYDEFSVSDLDKNGVSNIVSFLHKETEEKYWTKLYDIENQQLKLIDEIFTEENLLKVKVLAKGNAIKDQPAMFIQKNRVGSFNFLQVITMKENKILTLYNGILSGYLELRDINADGIIEVKREEKINSNLVAQIYSPKIISWNVFEGSDQIKAISREYVNEEYGYAIDIPLEWVTSFVIVSENDLKTDRITFMNVADNFIITDKIFSIVVTESVENPQDLPKKTESNSVVLYTTSKYTYTAIAYSGEAFEAAQLDSIKKMFRKIE